MPYRSKKQLRWMHAFMPDLAKKWDAYYGTKIVKKKSRTKRRKT